MRRQANVRAVGLRPRNLCFPEAERAAFHRRPPQPLREGVAGRGGDVYPAGCSTRARTKRTVQ